MNAARRVPRKVWLLLAIAAAAWLYGASTGWFGPRDSRAAFLDAVQADLARDPRVAIVHVDHAAGRLVVTVKPIQQTFTLVVTTKPAANGQPGEEWDYEWHDSSGNAIIRGRVAGTLPKSIPVKVPGLPDRP
jgi:hypothetical protein